MSKKNKMSYKERLKLEYRQNSMLYKFYLWLFNKKHNPKNKIIELIAFASTPIYFLG